MSMHDYPIDSPVAFLIDREVMAYINLAELDGTEEIPEGLKNLSRKEQVKKVLSGEVIFNDAFNPYVCEEILDACGHTLCRTSEFDGTVTHLSFDDGRFVDRDEEDMSQERLLWMEPMKEMSYFKAAYRSFDELVDEFRKEFADDGFFPEDFDFAAHIVAIYGTDYC